MKTSSDFLAHLESSGDLKKKLSSARTADEVVKLAHEAGFQANKNSMSSAMRDLAEAELQKRGFPDWAVNSVLLGETVCW